MLTRALATLTLQQMKREMEGSVPQKPAVSVSSISRALDSMLISLKLAEDVPDGKNAQQTLELQVQYAQWFMEEGVVGHCVVTDKCGFNI